MKTILVLDDDSAIAGLIRMLAERNGYAVLDSASPAQALERFEENDGQVDLLIADVVLKDGSGLDVAMELRSLVPYLKIIVMSGFPPEMWNDEDGAELLEFPSDSVSILQKPFSPLALMDQIYRLIGKPVSTAAAPALAHKAVA